MTRLLSLLMLLAPLLTYGQNYINLNKYDIKKIFNQTSEKKKIIKYKFANNKNNLIVTEGGSKKCQVKYEFSFDSVGKCNKEKIIFFCDTCMQHKLNPILGFQQYQWRKINENQYISRYEDRLMIELSPEKNVPSFSILRMDWTRILYDILTDK
jgi:hypothetical protein